MEDFAHFEGPKISMAIAPDPFHPSLSLLAKLGSIVVHADEATSDNRHEFDIAAIRIALEDSEVQAWIRDMGPLLPKKR